MSLTGNSSQIEKDKIVIFGAGKIGRSFIGQLFGQSGYKAVFIDVDPVIINLLNKEGKYRVIIKGDREEEIIVQNVSAVMADDWERVVETVATAAIAAVSVGKKALEKVVPVIAAAIERRFSSHPDQPIDIILAENMRSAAEYVREILTENMPAGFPVEKYTGLIETSIGKMVPIIPVAELEKDPLVVFAEPYNTLILDAKGFKNPIPPISGLAPKENIKAWVDRKAFIHNLGHAAAAYYGFTKYPTDVYMFEVLDHSEVFSFTREVMLQAADILAKIYPGDYSKEDLSGHIDDLLYRFRNRALKDTVFRVGQDLPRKLGANDRFMDAIHLAISCSMPYDRIVKAMSFGFNFRAADESGNRFPADVRFIDAAEKDFESAIKDILCFDPVTDRLVIDELNRLYKANSL
jgi:mannitol-1-phosphate 5-dehydrogenase